MPSELDSEYYGDNFTEDDIDDDLDEDEIEVYGRRWVRLADLNEELERD